MTAATALDDGTFWPSVCFETKPAAAAAAAAGVGGLWREELKTLEKDFRFEFGESLLVGEEDEFFARLTQRLSLSESRNVSPVNLRKSSEGLKVSGGSPQSTLGGVGSWSGRSSNGSNHNSPPATPFDSDDDTLGLIYAAADKVARLERNVEDPLQAALNGQWRAVAKPKPLQYPNACFHSDLQMKQKYMASAWQASEAAVFWEHHLHNINRSETYPTSRYGELLYQSARSQLQPATVAVKLNFQTVPMQRKESAGTGVFIPRRYDSSSTLPPRKRTVAPCALLPAKVIQALNTSIETMSGSAPPHCSPIHSSASLSQQSYDVLMARRRALLDQQQRSMVRRTEDISSRCLEACLPQEWSY